MTRLDEIEARLAAATPGPWFDGMGTHGNPADGPEFCEVRTKSTDERTRGITIAELPLDKGAAQDAELIAHAPADLAALLAVVKAVRTKAEGWAALAPDDDWGEDIAQTIVADAGRAILATLDAALSEPEQP